MPSWLPLFPERASSLAGSVDSLYFFLVGLSLFFSLLIAGLIVYCAIKYRRRSPDQLGIPNPGNLSLEMTWIVIPFILSMIIFVWGTHIYFAQAYVPKNGIDIYISAKQWMWKFQHLDGQREINELHVPIHQNIRLTMVTEDVIHSFYVPAFRIKADVVPGRVSMTWFQAIKPGRYHLFCAEYCGTNHSGMGGWVYVMEPADYQAWLSGGAAEGSLASYGEKLFQQLACNSCHRSDTQGRGPMLAGLFGRTVLLQNGETVVADENYIRESIVDPRAKIVAGFQPIMPSFKSQLSEEQLLQLIAYIRSLGPMPGSPAGPTEATQGPIGGTAAPDAQRSNPVGSTPPRERPPTPARGSK